MPNLILYLVNASCSFGANAVLVHSEIPVAKVELKFGPDGVEPNISRAGYFYIHLEGYVPPLNANGQVITEFPAILNYMSSLVPVERLFSDDRMALARVFEWLDWPSGTLRSSGCNLPVG